MTLTNIKIFGLPRTCTNVVQVALKKNFECEVYTNSPCWKHGPVDGFDPVKWEWSGVPIKDTKFVICTRDPFNWMQALYNFDSKMYQGRGDPGTWENWLENGSPIYDYADPLDKWNYLQDNWLSISTDPTRVHIVKNEDMKNAQWATIRKIGKALKLNPRSDSISMITKRVGPSAVEKRVEFKPEEYPDYTFSKEKAAMVYARINPNVTANMGYELHAHRAKMMQNYLGITQTVLED